MPSLTTPLVVTPGVVARQLPDGAVVVHLPGNRIFELNDTGARIWALASEGLTGEAIVLRLADEFDVDVAVAEHDVQRWLEQLAAEDLLQP